MAAQGVRIRNANRHRLLQNVDRECGGHVLRREWSVAGVCSPARWHDRIGPPRTRRRLERNSRNWRRGYKTQLVSRMPVGSFPLVEREVGSERCAPERSIILCGFRSISHWLFRCLLRGMGPSLESCAEGRLLASICDVPHPFDRHVALDMLNPRVYLSEACDLLVFGMGIKDAEQMQLQSDSQSFVTSWPRLDPTLERQTNTKAWRKPSLPWLLLA